MTLLELAKHYNLIVRQSDAQRKQLSDEHILQFKYHQGEHTLEKVLERYQSKLDKDGELSCEDIANLAKDIVNSQHFVDGNHRTALLICYHLNLFINHQLLRIKPYLLYASIDFEYLKKQHALDHEAVFFSNNAIQAAMLSRPMATIKTEGLRLTHMEMLVKIVSDMPELLEKIAENIRKPHNSACTQQDRLFRTYAGFRMHNEHSSIISIQSYRSSIFHQKLDEQAFSPSPIIKAQLF